MSEPCWLDSDAVLEIHREVIMASGGSDGVRDIGLLESALARPQNVLAYENGSIFDLAAAYAEAIAHNHPFIDGKENRTRRGCGVFQGELRADSYRVINNRLS